MRPGKNLIKNGKTRGPWPLLFALLSLYSSCGHKQPGEPVFPGGTAVIYEEAGARPASGAIVKVFEAGSTDDDPLAVYLTDGSGRFSIENLAAGIYTIVAEKDSLYLLQDSVIVATTQTTLRDDTLECASSLTGTVGVRPDDDPRTVTIRLAGMGRSFKVIDINGGFTLSGLASGRYSLQLSSTNSQYIPTARAVVVPVCSHDTIRDALTLRSYGVPVVSGIRIAQDTSSGAIGIAWNETAHRDLLDYLVYREHCEAKDFVHEPLHASQDTFFVDSLYVFLKADLTDTLERCLRYWIAVRTNGREIGTAYRYTEWRLAPKSFIMTALSHGVRNAVRPCDSASINDTVLFSVKARNRTRPIRSIVWYDPEKKDTVSRTIVLDRLHREVGDTVHYSFGSLGTHRLIVIAEDYAGVQRTDTAGIAIVPDIPVADAGIDTGVFAGEKVRLHGRARQEFGRIAVWKWKIGDGPWRRTSGPDTVVVASHIEEAVVCSLGAIDEDGNSGFDAMKIITSYKVKNVAAGYFHSLILKADGSCWACGNNENGQLGDGTGYTQVLPVKVLDSVKSVAAGWLHSLFLKTDGTLWACGNNDSGRLGDGTNESRFLPVKVIEGVQSMAAGGQHSLILKTDNTLWACGDNDSGQLGDGTNTSRLTPVQVMSDVKAVAAGGRHSMALKADGTLWTCGKGRSGQLGTETDIDHSTFSSVMNDVKAVAGGDRHTLYLKNDGSLWTSGNNWYGQLGDNSGNRRLAPEMAMTDVQTMAAGVGFSLVVKTDGTLWAFGKNSEGQLGIGNAQDTVARAIQVTDDVQAISAGESHSLILKTDGSLWGCGDNSDGQLGDTVSMRRLRPMLIIPPQR